MTDKIQQLKATINGLNQGLAWATQQAPIAAAVAAAKSRDELPIQGYYVEMCGDTAKVLGVAIVGTSREYSSSKVGYDDPTVQLLLVQEAPGGINKKFLLNDAKAFFVERDIALYYARTLTFLHAAEKALAVELERVFNERMASIQFGNVLVPSQEEQDAMAEELAELAGRHMAGVGN